VLRPVTVPVPEPIANVTAAPASEPLLTVWPAASWIVAVRVLAAALGRFAVEADRTIALAAPEVRLAVLVALVALHERHPAVTVYVWVPAPRPVSVQLVAVIGAAAVPQAGAAVPLSRVT